jgi:hypothetical protein
MTPLIKRLKEATKGSRELDAEIALAVGWTFEKWAEGRERKPYWRAPGETKYFNRFGFPPQFSRSLDAALTLVPEGMSGHVDIGKMSGIYQCGLWNGKFAQDVKENYGESKATPALALVIAALKAREQ